MVEQVNPLVPMVISSGPNDLFLSFKVAPSADDVHGHPPLSWSHKDRWDAGLVQTNKYLPGLIQRLEPSQWALSVYPRIPT